MSNSIEVTPLMTGRRIVLHVYIKNDGVSGDETNVVIADPADYEFADGFFTVESIQSSLDEFSASLKFGYLVSGNPVWVLPDGYSEFNFKFYGGLKDRSPELDGDGKVLLSTRGLSGGKEGSFVISLIK